MGGVLPRLALLTLLVAMVLGASAAEAIAPAGPRLAVNVYRPYPGDGSSLETVGPTGGEPQRLVGGEGEDVRNPNNDRPVWSPDGTLVAFLSSLRDLSPVPFVVGAEGGKPRLVAKVTPLSDPIFTADGRWLAFSMLRVVKGEFQRRQTQARASYGVIVDWAIWKVSLDGKRYRQVTKWKRNQRLTPTSYSPGGRFLAAEREELRRQDAVIIDLESRGVRVVARNASEPVFSPDGSRIAYVRTKRGRPKEREGNLPPASSSLVVVPADPGGKPQRIARIRGGLAWPSWDSSGSRIAFTRLGGGDPFMPSIPADGNSVMQVNADGTCLGTLLSIDRGYYAGVAWQPGPGRGTGPISC